MDNTEKLRDLGLAVIDTELEAIADLRARINNHFSAACQLLLSNQGRIIVTGMGKSGHIASKIAATLASTGSPAFYVHPGEACHGDMGMITPNDIVVAISNSGSTDEILTLVPILKRLNITLISMTGNPQSQLAKAASVNLDVSVKREACALDLAPTSSTTAALVMGDALAVTLMEMKGFTSQDFALSHPGGSLGRRLLLRVDDIMHTGDAIPRVYKEVTLSDTLYEVTNKGLGLTTVLNADEELLGIFTDGDLRRAMDSNIDVHKTRVFDVMTANPKTILPGTLAAEALALMEKHKITALIVMDEARKPQGIIHMHDLLKAGIA